MKKVFLFLAVMACMLSCRSVKNEGYIQQHHYSRDADTLALVSVAEKRDSSSYFHGVIDSLSSELRKVRQENRKLYERDSINEVTNKSERVHIKDSAWVQINPDGTFTYYKYREKNTYTYEQFERYRQQVLKESQTIIDSLIEWNTSLQFQYDSIYRENQMLNDLMRYEALHDSIYDSTTEKEKQTIYKNSFWDKVKFSVCAIIFMLIIGFCIYIYFRFFRRR
jgi:lipopolysaccharide export LptBFGC system permease protein LptF